MNMNKELKQLDKYNWKRIEWYKKFYIEFIKMLHRAERR